MTLAISTIYRDGIVTSIDQALTRRDTVGDVYQWTFPPITKQFQLSGVGCYSVWGELTPVSNKLFQFKMQLDSANLRDVTELRDRVAKFVEEDIYLSSEFHDDVGFHVCGYDEQGVPKLFHKYWGDKGGPNLENPNQNYDESNHHRVGDIVFNGQNFGVGAVVDLVRRCVTEPDLAEIAVKYNAARKDDLTNYLAQNPHSLSGVPQDKYSDAALDFSNAIAESSELSQIFDALVNQHNLISAVQFHDLLIQHAALITKRVGGTIFTSIILPSNRILLITNSSKQPLRREQLSRCINDAKASTDHPKPCRVEREREHIPDGWGKSILQDLSAEEYTSPPQTEPPIQYVWGPGTADCIPSATENRSVPYEGGVADFGAESAPDPQRPNPADYRRWYIDNDS